MKKYRAIVQVGFWKTTALVKASSEDIAERRLKNQFAVRMSVKEEHVKVHALHQPIYNKVKRQINGY